MRHSLCLLAVALAGCQKPPALDGALPVHPVGGTLTHRGVPMAGAQVTFYPLAPRGSFDPCPSAKADGEGRYRLTTYNTADGAPAGGYRVTVYWPGERLGTPNDEGDLPPDRLLEEFAGKATSRLRAEVKPGENVVNFDLPN